MAADRSSCYTCEDNMVLDDGTCCTDGVDEPNGLKTKCCAVGLILTAGDRTGYCCENGSRPSDDGTACTDC